MSKYGLDGLNDEPLRRLHGTRNFVSGKIARGTTTSKIKTVTNTLEYTIKGVLYELAATDDLWTLSGSTVAVSSTCVFALCLNSAGTASIVQGTRTLSANITAGTLAAPDVSDDTLCVIGYVKVVTDSSHTFIPGTTALNAAGITATYYNVSVPPLAGQLG